MSDVTEGTQVECVEEKINKLKLTGVEMRLTDKRTMTVEMIHLDKNVKKLVIPDGIRVLTTSWDYNDEYRGEHRLEDIKFPQSLVHIDGCLFTEMKNIKEVWLPQYLQSLGAFAFSECSGLKKVHFNTNLNYIGEYAFYSCNLEGTLELPLCIQRIGEECFTNNNIEVVDFEKAINLKSVGPRCFSHCNKLSALICPPKDLDLAGKNVFLGCSLIPLGKWRLS